MGLLTNGPRGTQDLLPQDSANWQYIESSALRTAELYGFSEIRFPTFEHTELFLRSVGDTTDVVQKEMYTFQDKGDRSITLRPEGTAGTLRAAIEHGLVNDALPLKLSYLTSCFRYEKPQAGRLREFHQFGIEMLGASSPSADAQVIALANDIFETLGVSGLTLEINSIGCQHCRPKYHAALKAYFEQHKENLCPTCLERLEKNPMRILDCKNPACAKIAAGAPVVLDYICDDCKTHFTQLQQNLNAMQIPFVINPNIVRGLDYYIRTVFEFVSTDIGAQGTVCGGGRYDGLVSQLGGPDISGIGFAMGIERLYLLMQKQQCEFPPKATCDVYIASIGETAGRKALELTSLLRKEGYAADCDTMDRSVKAQMKYAGKIKAKYTIVLGDNELEQQQAMLKNMTTAQQTPITLGDNFVDAIYQEFINHAYTQTEEAAKRITK